MPARRKAYQRPERVRPTPKDRPHLPHERAPVVQRTPSSDAREKGSMLLVAPAVHRFAPLHEASSGTPTIPAQPSRATQNTQHGTLGKARFDLLSQSRVSCCSDFFGLRPSQPSITSSKAIFLRTRDTQTALDLLDENVGQARADSHSWRYRSIYPQPFPADRNPLFQPAAWWSRTAACRRSPVHRSKINAFYRETSRSMRRFRAAGGAIGARVSRSKKTLIASAVA